MDILTSGYYTLEELYPVIAGLSRKFHKRHPSIEVDDFYQSGLLNVIELYGSDPAMIDLNKALSAAAKGMAACYMSLRNPSQNQYKRYKFESEVREDQAKFEEQDPWIIFLWNKLLTHKERQWIIRAKGLDGKTPQGFARAARQIFEDSNGDDWELRLDCVKNKMNTFLKHPQKQDSDELKHRIRYVKAMEFKEMWKKKRNRNAKSDR